MWILIAAIVALIAIFVFRPFARYKRKVIKEYRNWRGRDLYPVDTDLVEVLRTLHKQGLSPREARIIICTYQDKGPLEAMQHMATILSGENYHSEAENHQTSTQRKTVTPSTTKKRIMDVTSKIIQSVLIDSKESTQYLHSKKVITKSSEEQAYLEIIIFYFFLFHLQSSPQLGESYKVFLDAMYANLIKSLKEQHEWGEEEIRAFHEQFKQGNGVYRETHDNISDMSKLTEELSVAFLKIINPNKPADSKIIETLEEWQQIRVDKIWNYYDMFRTSMK